MVSYEDKDDVARENVNLGHIELLPMVGLEWAHDIDANHVSGLLCGQPAQGLFPRSLVRALLAPYTHPGSFFHYLLILAVRVSFPELCEELPAAQVASCSPVEHVHQVLDGGGPDDNPTLFVETVSVEAH